MEPLLLTRDGSGVVTLTINRPEKKNAILPTMWSDLTAVFDEVAESVGDRVLVITGAGDAFCSGADLTPGEANAMAGGVGTGLRQMSIVGRCALRLHELPKPTIAAVNGVAAGAGCNLALGCDLIVASDTARFTEIFVRRGLNLDFGGSWLLSRLVGLHRAKELAFFGDILSAADAERIGLVNQVVPASDLDDVVTAMARRLAALPPIQLSLIKQSLNKAASTSMAEALEFEDVAQVLAFGTRDAVEAVTAFVQKREPRFVGE
jgi:2-(1,2-epoxy-1,2-dihydrophenyl)acetyl-CoA isomerase